MVSFSSPVPIPLGLDMNPLACPGVELKLLRSVWANYPWHIHNPNLGRHGPLSFYPCGQNHFGDSLCVRSNTCTGFRPSIRYKSCVPCAEVASSREVKSILERMEDESPVNGLNLAFYSHKQLADLLYTKEEKLKKFRLQVSTSNL